MTPHLTEEQIMEAVLMRASCDSDSEAARRLGLCRAGFQHRMKRAAERGLVKPGVETMPGYVIKSVAKKEGDAWIKQVKEAGEPFKVPDGHIVKGVSALVDADGRVIQSWQKTAADAQAQQAAMQAAVEAFKEELPRAEAAPAPTYTVDTLLNQFVVTDSHFGMLAWREETGSDYDLKIAEQLLLDWFSAAIDLAPKAHTAIFAQLGDLMHHDALESVTPAHKHVLDADSRLQKIIRVVIRTIRRVLDMLLRKHQHVHVVMASGNHDPASSAWLREMLAAFYENEPRITVDNSPSLYYAYEWGQTMLAYHHGHKRGVNDVDAVLASVFREMYGRCSVAYAHVGHRHSDEGKKTKLMYVEQHETLAAKDAFNAGGGWPGGRSAKVITYTKSGGEVTRITLRPEMVMGASREAGAANDNQERRAVA